MLRDIPAYDFRRRTPIVLAKNMPVPEYMELPESSVPHNLIAGTLYRSACPTFAHQKIVAAVAEAFAGARRRGAGEVILSPLDCLLSEDTVIQPDVGFVAAERASIFKNYVMGPPDLAVEIAHIETTELDGAKLAAYARNGVREAWLVDPEAESVTLFFGDGTKWIEETSVLFGEPVPSRVVSVGDAGLGQFKDAGG